VTSNQLCLLASLWLVATANQSFWSLFLRNEGANGSAWLFAASLVVALVGLHFLLLRLLSPGRSVRWIVSLLLAVGAAAGWFMDTFGVAIDTGMLLNVAQTDVAEARDFIGWPLLWRLTWQAALPIVLLWSIPLRSAHVSTEVRDYVLGSMAGLSMVLCAAVPLYSHYASFFRNQDSARYLVAPANVVVGSVNLVRKTLKSRQPYVQVGLDAHRAAPDRLKPLVVVMVVGETARAANFSLGGYQRKTNPRLEGTDVVYFADVTSCGTATAVSVPCMFSDLPRAEFDLSKAQRRDNVLDMVKRSGIDVTWIDNQSGCKGVCARVPTRAAEQDHPQSCAGGECLDDALLYALPVALRAVHEDSLIVLHAMGSHGPTYHRRVPEQHELFKPICPTERIETCSDEQIVNSYDNSIAYTDYVLSGLIEQLVARQDEIDSLVLYVSDHGESLGEKGLYLHGQPWLIAPEVQKRVPLLFWFSSGATARLSLDEACLWRRATLPASHDNVAHTLLGMLNVATHVYRPGLDLLRHCRSGKPGAVPDS
jgi:lipid A ethanolaminephosphotransferase